MISLPVGCSILRLRGLPFDVSENDLCEFFKDSGEVIATHLGVRNGKPTGEAYVQFKDAQAASSAYKDRQGEHMGHRYVEIFEAGEASLLAQVSGVEPSLQGHLVRLRGLPFASSAEEVLAFLSPVSPLGGEAGVVFTCTPDGRPTGEAYIELGSAEDKGVVLGKHKERLGPRYVEVFESSKAELYQAVHQRGFFTAVGGRRRHHPPVAQSGAAPQQPAGQLAHGGGSRGVGEVTQSFAGFSISHRDAQVPGPPRGGYTAAAYPVQGDRQYSAIPQMGGGSAPGQWPQMAMPGGRPAVFNPAPGPAGARPGGRGGGIAGCGYGGQPVLLAPFMMQHPFVQHQQQVPQQWGGGMVGAQQGPGWYGPPVNLRGMGGAYSTAYPHPQHHSSGYYAQQAAQQQWVRQTQYQQQYQQQQQRSRPQNAGSGAFDGYRSGHGGGSGAAPATPTSVASSGAAGSGRVSTAAADAGSVASAGSAQSCASLERGAASSSAQPSPLSDAGSEAPPRPSGAQGI